jgi:hypothetical protein
MAHLCLMWCIWRKQNGMSFEVCEILVLKSDTFKSCYAWSAVYNSPRCPHFLLNFFFFFFFHKYEDFIKKSIRFFY